MIYEISREYSFCAAHQLEGHPKCGRLHGHNYRVAITVLSIDLDPQRGWIMDFGDMDKVVKPVIDSLDHRYIVSDQNRSHNNAYAELAIEKGDAVVVLGLEVSTAECIAKWLHTVLSRAMGHRMLVEIWETPKNRAAYGPEAD